MHDILIELFPDSGHRLWVGKALPKGPVSEGTGACSPKWPTRAFIILVVTDQEQLVVHRVFITSSKTVEPWIIHPAPLVTQDSSGSIAAKE